MVAIGLALAASLAFGFADFLGGIESRRLPIRIVLGVSIPIGLLAFLSVLAVRDQPTPDVGFLPFAVGTSVLGVVGVAALYGGLAVGQMGTVAVIAGIGPVIPVLVGFARGEHVGPAAFVGIVLALSGAWLVGRGSSWRSTDRHHRIGIALGAGAAVSFGAALVCLDHASAYDPYWTVFAVRATSTLLIAVVLLVNPVRSFPGRRHLLLLGALGVLEVAGTCLFALSTTKGALSVVSAMASLPPLVIVLLARAFLSEHMTTAQLLGLGTALAGVALVWI